MNLKLYAPLVIQGFSITMLAWSTAASISMIVGTIFGILTCNKISSKNNLLKMVAILIRFTVFVAKAIPAYVQILIAYFIVPTLIGLQISGIACSIIALAFCSSGYVAEIVRGGINSISSQTWDACYVLGYSTLQTLMRVVLPQTACNIIPALIGECEQLLKSTSLMATIGVTELVRAGLNIISRELTPTPVYVMIVFIYLIIAAVLQVALFLYERLRYDYR